MGKRIYELGDGLNIVYNTILDYVKTNGYPPSVREICRLCNFKSTATTQYYLNRLEQKGYILKGKGRTSRTIKLLK